ncbi:hypothetical protein [Brochothrix thermosphacta]|uniref:hypothetical protein n=1 Tax=Brochothrix thermosphacta TaxID=2756 RepID=UPI00160198D1|nr:hypothetical protein [Brochothrix thermosphacta]
MSLQVQYGTQRQRVPILQAVEYQSSKQLSTNPYVGIFTIETMHSIVLKSSI